MAPTIPNGSVTARERERREAQRQAAASQTIFPKPVPVTLPGIGTVDLRLRNPDIAYAERTLMPLLDEVPAERRGRWVTRAGDPCHPDTDGARWEEFANIWDGLEVLGTRYPVTTVSVLLTACLGHVGVTQAQVDDLPPSVFNDPDVERAIEAAIAVAFGDGVGDDDARPTQAADTPAASTGSAS